MRQCPRCSGFVPGSVNACPNCAFTPRARRRGGLFLTWIAAGSTMITGCACYGIPCAGTKLPNGTIKDGAGNERVCLDCTEKIADGGTLGSDPGYVAECHPDGGP
jgi:hypothetical protein